MTDAPKNPENKTLEDKVASYGEKVLSWTSPDRWLPKRKVPDPHEIIYGTLNDRVFANAVDTGIIIMLFFKVFYWISQFVDDTGSNQLMNNAILQGASQDQLTRIATDTDFFGNLFQSYALQLSFIGMIVVALWHYSATSPGKWLMRLRVVNEADGIPIKAGQAVLRYVSYFASPMLGLTIMLFLLPIIGAGIGTLVGFVIALAGFFWVGWDDKKQGWHDKIAGTAVIKVKHWQFKASKTSEYPVQPADEDEESDDIDEAAETPSDEKDSKES